MGAPRVFVTGPVSWNTMVDLDRLPDPRPQMVLARGHRDRLGGTSAGKALNLADLGCAVTLRTQVGSDEYAARILRALQVPGVAVLAEHAHGPSERHLNLMAADGRRLSIYLDLPAPAAEVHGDAARRALADCDVAVVDLADSARPWLDESRRLGKPVWCDLHDYDGAASFHRPWVDAADVVFLSDDAMAAPAPFMRACLDRGASLVVCTQGARGALAVTARGEWHRPAETVADVVDVNGAGDAFFAGFLVRHLAGGSVEECLAAGHRQAARAVRSPGLAP